MYQGERFDNKRIGSGGKKGKLWLSHSPTSDHPSDCWLENYPYKEEWKIALQSSKLGPFIL